MDRVRAVVQRVTRASVTVDGGVIGQISSGLLILLGVTGRDSTADAAALAAKIANLRVFADEKAPLNRSILEVEAGALVVSQFTLYADVRKGRRPSLTDAAPPGQAEPLVDAFVEFLSGAGVRVETGQFGAKMAVELVNDGPVTIIIETEDGRVV